MQKAVLSFFVVIAIFGMGLGGVYAYLYQRSLQTLEPVGNTNVDIPVPPPKLKIMYGFLPFWLMKDAYISPSLTDVAYFSLPVSSDGNWQKKDGASANPGWRTFQSDRFNDLRIQTLTNRQRLSITISLLTDETIDSFLANPDAQDMLIRNTMELLREQAIDGINIDVEHLSPSSPLQRQQFVTFMEKFSTSVRTKTPAPHISIDIYASATKPTQIWDLKKLAPYTDHFIIMGYDFHHRSSAIAGPNAPLYGKTLGRWDTDIMTSLKSIMEEIQPNQIILGIPLYGYEWKTTKDTLGAPTFPKSGRVASLKRIQEELSLQPNVSSRWDWDSLTPYLAVADDTGTRIISYENAQSLQYKLDSARQAGLAGVAFWALGYATAEDPIWKLLPDASQNPSPVL